MVTDLEAIFPRLLAPIVPATFLAEHWGRKALHIRGPADKLAPWQLGRERFFELLDTAPRLNGPRRLKAQYYGVDGKSRDLAIDSTMARGLYDAGMTICATSLEQLADELKQLSAAAKLHLNLPGLVGINCYVSPRGKGFPLHFDRDSVFILQTEGSKRWHYSAVAAIDAPPNNVAAQLSAEQQPELDYTPPDASTLCEVVLQPGDVLYLPPGTWHRASAGDEGSVALTLTCVTYTFADFIAEVTASQFLPNAEWRANMPPVLADRTQLGLPPAIEAFFAERLRELQSWVATLTPQQLARPWLVRTTDLSLPAAAPPAAAPPIAADDKLTAPYGITIVDDPEQDRILVRCVDKLLALPRDSRPLLQQLAERREFAADDVCGWQGLEGFDWSELAPALDALLEQGIVTRL